MIVETTLVKLLPRLQKIIHTSPSSPSVSYSSLLDVRSNLKFLFFNPEKVFSENKHGSKISMTQKLREFELSAAYCF